MPSDVHRIEAMKYSFENPRVSPLPLALVVLAHVGVLWGMSSLRQAAVPPQPEHALMVDVIAPEPMQPEQPEVPQPKPVEQRREPPRPTKQQPVLATQSAAVPEQAVTPKPVEPTPVTPVETHAAPTTVAAAQTATETVRAPVASAPRYDANYLKNPKPVYPPLSQRQNEQGTVKLRVLVEATGLPSKVEVERSSGFERLDKSAVAAVTRWEFVPAKLGSQAVSGWVSVPIVFSLTE